MNSVTTFENYLATKILEALDDTTIGHLTKASNIIMEEMEKYKAERIKQLEQSLIDANCRCEELQMELELEHVKRGEWIPFKECSPKDFGLDWVLVQFVEKESGHVGLPNIAEYGVTSTGEPWWHLASDDTNTEHYLNNDCYASSWKIIEHSPEWLEQNPEVCESK